MLVNNIFILHPASRITSQRVLEVGQLEVENDDILCISKSATFTLGRIQFSQEGGTKGA